MSEGIANESSVGCNDWFLPKIVTTFENGDIGNLNGLKDSNRDKKISIQKLIPVILMAFFRASFVLKLIETVNTIAAPQKI